MTFSIVLAAVFVLALFIGVLLNRNLRQGRFSSAGTLNFVHYVQRLKHEPRNGWSVDGREVPNSESVGSHTFGFAMLCYFLARHLGFKPSDLYELALVHDMVEGVPGVGDIVIYHLSGEARHRAEVLKRDKERAAIARIADALPKEEAERIKRLWYEYDEGKTARSKIVKQLDKLEAALQAIAYEAQGHKAGADEYIRTTYQQLTHPYLIRVLDRAVQLRGKSYLTAA